MLGVPEFPHKLKAGRWAGLTTLVTQERNTHSAGICGSDASKEGGVEGGREGGLSYLALALGCFQKPSNFVGLAQSASLQLEHIEMSAVCVKRQ